MMLHQDGSTHEWVKGKSWDLIITLDDATNEHYSIFFVDEEGTASSFQGVKEVIEKYGLFSPLYTDRGSHYWLTLEKEGLQLFPILTSGARTICLNNHDQKDTPFKDVRVRRALNYCIDRKQLAKALMGNLAIPIGQGYHPDISPWGYEDIKPVNRDIEKAKKLLKKAGYPNGLDVVFTITPTWGKNDIMADRAANGQAGRHSHQNQTPGRSPILAQLDQIHLPNADLGNS
ncbi:MAG: hypothetical protein JRI85_12205, partial [Deltaproteobacteria bacterium]|nr:hypothetical protein [Deltaproteobacteria bacterium]